MISLLLKSLLDCEDENNVYQEQYRAFGWQLSAVQFHNASYVLTAYLSATGGKSVPR